MFRQTCILGRDDKSGYHVCQAKEEMRNGQPPDIGHCLAQGRLDHAVPHAHNQEQEEAEGAAGRVKDGDNYKQDSGTDICAIAVLMFWFVNKPCLTGRNAFSYRSSPMS